MTVDESSQASESDQKTTSVCGYPRTSEADGADRASKRRKMEQSVEDDTSRHEEVEDSLTIKVGENFEFCRSVSEVPLFSAVSATGSPDERAKCQRMNRQL